MYINYVSDLRIIELMQNFKIQIIFLQFHLIFLEIFRQFNQLRFLNLYAYIKSQVTMALKVINISFTEATYLATCLIWSQYMQLKMTISIYVSSKLLFDSVTKQPNYATCNFKGYRQTAYWTTRLHTLLHRYSRSVYYMSSFQNVYNKIVK